MVGNDGGDGRWGGWRRLSVQGESGGRMQPVKREAMSS